MGTEASLPRPERVLLIVNPVAMTVSGPTLDVIEKALAADFKLDVHHTVARGHAVDLARQAVDEGVDMVVAFSGDGTINEVANGLAGTEVALGIIPGGATNVLARGLGLPEDPVEATGLLIRRALGGLARRVNLGVADGRYFTFSCGAGIDAAAMARLEARPHASRTSFQRAALRAVVRELFLTYGGRSPDLRVAVGGRPAVAAVSVLVGKAHPYTFFRRWGLKLVPHASLDRGLDVLIIRRLVRRAFPRLAWQLFVTAHHLSRPDIGYFRDASAVDIEGERPFPVQVDGDYLGLRERLRVSLAPGALWVVA